MTGNFRAQTKSFYYFDIVGSGVNPIAPYQCVSLATTAQVATANAAGCPGGVGDIVVPTPVTAGLATAKVVGVTQNATLSGELVNVVVSGTAFIMANAAITFGPSTLISPAIQATRTSAQTPFTNNFDMLIPVDPRIVFTYQLCMIDDTAITPSSGAANVAGYFVGYALKAATAQYDIIPVELDLGVKYY